jgi:hypothetical protein
MEERGPTSTPEPGLDAGPLQESDILLWEGLCERALEEQDARKLDFYLGAAESVGVPRQELLARLEQQFPDDPLLQSQISESQPLIADEELPPSLEPPLSEDPM